MKMAATRKIAVKTEAKPKVETKTSAAKITAARKAAPVAVASTVASREDHFNRIQKEAYFLAEKDGFKGDPTKYWLAAEANVLRAGR
jgi:hypothetical protein